MPNYLRPLRHFYKASGVDSLIDVQATSPINFLELGTVGENVADGPPPEPEGTSRGPCDSTTTGFRRQAGPWGYWDPRVSSGLLPRTIAAWFRFDSLSTDQEIFAAWSSGASTQHFMYRYENAFQAMIGKTRGGSNVSSGADNPNPIQTGVWNFGGISTDGQNVYVHANGFTRLASTTFGGFTNADLPNIRIGVTEVGISGSGIKGDIAYLMHFDIMFRPVDWLRFWKGGAGRRYPNQFIIPTGLLTIGG